MNLLLNQLVDILQSIKLWVYGTFLKKRLPWSWLELDKVGKKQKKIAARELNWNIWRCLWSNTRSISTLCVSTWLGFMFSKSLVYVSQEHLSTLKQLILGRWFQSLVLSVILKFCFSLFSVIFTQKETLCHCVNLSAALLLTIAVTMS